MQADDLAEIKRAQGGDIRERLGLLCGGGIEGHVGEREVLQVGPFGQSGEEVRRYGRYYLFVVWNWCESVYPKNGKAGSQQ